MTTIKYFEEGVVHPGEAESILTLLVIVQRARLSHGEITSRFTHKTRMSKYDDDGEGDDDDCVFDVDDVEEPLLSSSDTHVGKPPRTKWCLTALLLVIVLAGIACSIRPLAQHGIDTTGIKIVYMALRNLQNESVELTTRIQVKGVIYA
jgi:hypothetical protein